MKITSLNFFAFLGITALVYYIFPKRFRWISLLISSLFFFLLASYKVAFYFVIGVLISYIGALLIDKKCKTEKSKKIILISTIFCEMAGLFVLKYINIIPNTINGFGKLFNIDLNFANINLIAPIGISYYTLSIIAYVVDVYRTTIPAEKNIFKYTLYSCYYPCLISGPFIRYSEMKKEFFENECLDWNNIFKGFHRIVYGLLKKMVIADNVAILVKMIFEDISIFSGGYIILGLMLYALQIYCDFSGCMDIVIGASKLYGVKIPENFESPFFSKNLSEFWRRWHITLGLWGKDYIMYPLLKSEKFQKLGKATKKRFGKDIGKKIPVIISIFVLWLFIGIWHGASYKYIFAAGMLPWIYFSTSELLDKFIKKLTEKLHINTEKFSFHLFQSLRTLILMCIIWLFAISPTLLKSRNIIKNLFVVSNINLIEFLNKNIFNDVYKFMAIFFSIIGLTIVDYLKYKEKDVGEKFNSQGIIFRYLLLFGMISIILIFGVYGPGYNPADFIYGGF
ncbi:MAG: MBOAT family protein [Clostridia bacterium]|nr:MBOAT family protein [Clostridia bacterium]